MRSLDLEDGDPIHVQGTRLPKGKFVKLQPQTVDFLEISDPKAVLEHALRTTPRSLKVISLKSATIA